MSIPQPISVDSRAESPAAAILAAKRQQPFTEDSSGEVYFRSDYHHRQIAAAILARLAKGHHLLLASGDPAGDGELLESALNEAGGERYRATLVRSTEAMDFGALVRSCNRRLGLRQEAGSDGLWALLSFLMSEVRKGVRRILVLEDAETLDPVCFDELLRFARLDEPHVLPVVLLAGPGFAQRLNAGELAFLRSAITDRIAIDRLAPEEVGAFIRCQLNAVATEDEALFSAEAVERIATAAGGDPASVNRLARELLATARGESRVLELPAPAVEAPEVTAPAESSDEPADPAAPLMLMEPLATPPAVVEPAAPRLRLASPLAIGLYVLAAASSGLALVHWFAPSPPYALPITLASGGSAPAHAPSTPSTALPKTQIPSTAMAAAAPAAADIEPEAGQADAATPSKPEAVAEIPPPAPAPAAHDAAPPILTPPPPPPAEKSVVEGGLPDEQPAVPAKTPPATHAAAAAPAAGIAAPKAAPVPPPPAEKPVVEAALPDKQPVVPAKTPPAAHAAAAALAAGIVAPKAAPVPPLPEKPFVEAAPAEEKPVAPVKSPPATEAVVAAPHTAAVAAPRATSAPPAPAKEPVQQAALPHEKPAAPASSPAETDAVVAAPRVKPAAVLDPATLMMVKRGDALLMTGDIVSARSFFARAATAGDADAEFGLAKSYDPIFLHRIGVRGLGGDMAIALRWYRRAAADGSRAAADQLQLFGTTTSSRSTSEERR